jgi:hypothetical protein
MKKLMLSLLLISMISCSKSKSDESPLQDTLPPITTNGANTAGCIVNGKTIIPKNGINGISGFPVYGLLTYAGPNFNSPDFNDYYAIKITNFKNKDLNYSVYIHLNNLNTGAIDYIIGQSNGEYFIDGPNNPHIIVQEFKNNIYTGKLFLSVANSGIIKISRFDFPNHIISGTFNCTLCNKDNTAEKIQITNGRFDINSLSLNQ